jgi:hypothetical protein
MNFPVVFLFFYKKTGVILVETPFAPKQREFGTLTI